MLIAKTTVCPICGSYARKLEEANPPNPNDSVWVGWCENGHVYYQERDRYRLLMDTEVT
jgi:hypothetical protein